MITEIRLVEPLQGRLVLDDEQYIIVFLSHRNYASTNASPDNVAVGEARTTEVSVQGIICFTQFEWVVLTPILATYPVYCPFHRCLASYRGVINEHTLKATAAQLAEAYGSPRWEETLKPVRNLISRARLKLQPYGLDIAVVNTRGYVLMSGQLIGNGKRAGM